jgi:hypothetical protein
MRQGVGRKEFAKGAKAAKLARLTFALTMQKLRLPLLLIACILCGCQSDPWSFQYARAKPSQSIAGKYKLTVQSRIFLETVYKNVKSSHFELKSDSSFLIKNIASIWSPFPTAGGFENVKGKWSLVKHHDWWAIQLNVQSVERADRHLNQEGFITQVMLIGQQAPYLLHFGIGDSDTGEALQYELR